MNIPDILKNLHNVAFVGKKTEELKLVSISADIKSVTKSRPLRVGAVLSGGPAPGGHNVLWGLKSALTQLHSESELVGFSGGPAGIVKNKTLLIDDDLVQSFKNTGGFWALGTGRNKIETEAELQQALNVCAELQLDGLVIIGGDDSNTNAYVISEYFKSKQQPTIVVGVPKTIDSDLRCSRVATSFGFDTATKVYANLVSNIASDVKSTRKYYHFVRLMGRSASHITLEVALRTKPTFTLISEEVLAKKMSLTDIVTELAEIVVARSKNGLGYGVVLIPEGLIEFIPELRSLVEELNEVLSKFDSEIAACETLTDQFDLIHQHLSENSQDAFLSLPIDIRQQLIMERDPHGNAQLSRVESERLVAMMLNHELDRRKELGVYDGKFDYLRHFLGYEGRSARPSYFDAEYSYALGQVACLLVAHQKSGYMAAVDQLHQSTVKWGCYGVHLSSLIHKEMRRGKEKLVIQKKLVDLKSQAFNTFKSQRAAWAEKNCFEICDPVQFYGPEEVTHQRALSLALDKQGL